MTAIGSAFVSSGHVIPHFMTLSLSKGPSLSEVYPYNSNILFLVENFLVNKYCVQYMIFLPYYTLAISGTVLSFTLKKCVFFALVLEGYC